jgi:hypothetical protein
MEYSCSRTLQSPTASCVACRPFCRRRISPRLARWILASRTVRRWALAHWFRNEQASTLRRHVLYYI